VGGHVTTAFGAVGMTLACFLVLPLIQAISRPPAADMLLRPMETAVLTPPPPPPLEEPEEEPEVEEPPPELPDEVAPLDLAQLELALNPGFGGDGWMSPDFGLNASAVGRAADVDSLFNLSELDQEPRAIYQPQPLIDAKMRKRMPGTVYVVFVVDQRGRVENPVVLKSSDAVFERSALTAVKQWKFEPGKKSGQPVRFRMRAPITFK